MNNNEKLYGKIMDRRQIKTRESIFKAFILLLNKKHYNQITVAEIIDKANVGRATFYAHFETKDYLLKSLLEELFSHVFSNKSDDKNIFNCENSDSVILHLFKHFQKNDNSVLTLLSCPNNELFLSYFKLTLKRFLNEESNLFIEKKNNDVPIDFWINHIAVTFVETLKWWVDNDKKEPPEILVKYFMSVI